MKNKRRATHLSERFLIAASSSLLSTWPQFRIAQPRPDANSAEIATASPAIISFASKTTSWEEAARKVEVDFDSRHLPV